MTYDFEAQRRAWSSPPVEALNAYVSSAKMLAMPDEELRRLVATSEAERYSGWRNHNGLWREAFGLDTTVGKRVLDFGCGVGIEALQFAKAGNEVHVADIAQYNVQLALRVLSLHGFEGTGWHVSGDWPFIHNGYNCVDIFLASGVLHHIPYPIEVMRRAHSMLVPGGEARLMLYTSDCWRNQTGTEPPESNTQTHPQYQTFLRAMDQVGEWAEVYWPERVEEWFGKWFTLERWVSLTPWGNYAAAILRRRPG